MDELDNGGFGLCYTELLGAMADGLSINGQKTEGLVAVDRALARCEREEERWIVPELLRIKGELLLSQDRSSCAQAQEHFMRSLDCAREQQVLSWELRAATSLARLQRDSDGRETARDLLMSVYARFSEGFETADLKIGKIAVGRASLRSPRKWTFETTSYRKNEQSALCATLSMG